MKDDIDNSTTAKAAAAACAVADRVFKVSRDGAIKATLHASLSEACEEGPGQPSHIDDILPDELARRVARNLRRVIRERGYRADEMQDAEHGIHVEVILVADGHDTVLLILRDLLDRNDALHRMHRLAYVDETTSLPNRELFLNELNNITEFQTLKEGRVAVIICHVDHCDARNSFGAAQQDQILAEIGTRLGRALRGANTDDTSDLERRSVIARTDFHDFGIVLPSIENGADAEAVARRIVAAVSAPVQIGDRAIKLNAYAGVSLFPQDGTEAGILFENAVAAMEDARCSHDVDIKFHTGTVKLRTLQRQDLEVELRAALDTEEFTVHYQPIVDAKSGRIRKLEALLRWPESILGSRSTRKIVSIAERTTLIVAIGKWVMLKGCEQLRAWKDKGHENLRLAVNVSPQEFSRTDLAQTVSAALIRVGLQPSDIELEINEHILFRDAMKNYSMCRALKKLGVGVVVDDYGIGACSLAHLAHSPVDAIKIDNALVAQMESSGRDNAACHAAIAMGHALGLNITAEGVETEEQARMLTELGCDHLQGYQLYAPMTAEELTGYLELYSTTRHDRIIRGA